MADYRSLMQKFYIAFYGRPADKEGLEYWLDRIEQDGGITDALITDFGTHPEFKQHYGDASIQEGVDMIYRQGLSRPADVDGLQHWSGLVETNEMTLPVAMMHILNQIVGEDAANLEAKAKVADKFVEQFESGDKEFAGEAAAEVASALLEQVTAETDIDEFVEENVEQVSELVEVASKKPEIVKKMIPKDGHFSDLVKSMPEGSEFKDLVKFTKELAENAEDVKAIEDLIPGDGEDLTDYLDALPDDVDKDELDGAVVKDGVQGAKDLLNQGDSGSSGGSSGGSGGSGGSSDPLPDGEPVADNATITAKDADGKVFSNTTGTKATISGEQSDDGTEDVTLVGDTASSYDVELGKGADTVDVTNSKGVDTFKINGGGSSSSSDLNNKIEVEISGKYESGDTIVIHLTDGGSHKSVFYKILPGDIVGDGDNPATYANIINKMAALSVDGLTFSADRAVLGISGSGITFFSHIASNKADTLLKEKFVYDVTGNYEVGDIITVDNIKSDGSALKYVVDSTDKTTIATKLVAAVNGLTDAKAVASSDGIRVSLEARTTSDDINTTMSASNRPKTEAAAEGWVVDFSELSVSIGGETTVKIASPYNIPFKTTKTKPAEAAADIASQIEISGIASVDYKSGESVFAITDFKSYFPDVVVDNSVTATQRAASSGSPAGSDTTQDLTRVEHVDFHSTSPGDDTQDIDITASEATLSPISKSIKSGDSVTFTYDGNEYTVTFDQDLVVDGGGNVTNTADFQADINAVLSGVVINFVSDKSFTLTSSDDGKFISRASLEYGGAASDSSPSDYDVIKGFDVSKDKLDLQDNDGFVKLASGGLVKFIDYKGVAVFEESVTTLEAKIDASLSYLDTTKKAVMFEHDGDSYVVQGNSTSGTQSSDIVVKLEGVDAATADLGFILGGGASSPDFSIPAIFADGKTIHSVGNIVVNGIVAKADADLSGITSDSSVTISVNTNVTFTGDPGEARFFVNSGITLEGESSAIGDSNIDGSGTCNILVKELDADLSKVADSVTLNVTMSGDLTSGEKFTGNLGNFDNLTVKSVFVDIPASQIDGKNVTVNGGFFGITYTDADKNVDLSKINTAGEEIYLDVSNTTPFSGDTSSAFTGKLGDVIVNVESGGTFVATADSINGIKVDSSGTSSNLVITDISGEFDAGKITSKINAKLYFDEDVTFTGFKDDAAPDNFVVEIADGAKLTVNDDSLSGKTVDGDGVVYVTETTDTTNFSGVKVGTIFSGPSKNVSAGDAHEKLYTIDGTMNVLWLHSEPDADLSGLSASAAVTFVLEKNTTFTGQLPENVVLNIDDVSDASDRLTLTQSEAKFDEINLKQKVDLTANASLLNGMTLKVDNKDENEVLIKNLDEALDADLSKIDGDITIEIDEDTVFAGKLPDVDPGTSVTISVADGKTLTVNPLDIEGVTFEGTGTVVQQFPSTGDITAPAIKLDGQTVHTDGKITITDLENKADADLSGVKSDTDVEITLDTNVTFIGELPDAGVLYIDDGMSNYTLELTQIEAQFNEIEIQGTADLTVNASLLDGMTLKVLDKDENDVFITNLDKALGADLSDVKGAVTIEVDEDADFFGKLPDVDSETSVTVFVTGGKTLTVDSSEIEGVTFTGDGKVKFSGNDVISSLNIPSSSNIDLEFSANLLDGADVTTDNNVTIIDISSNPDVDLSGVKGNITINVTENVTFSGKLPDVGSGTSVTLNIDAGKTFTGSVAELPGVTKTGSGDIVKQFPSTGSFSITAAEANGQTIHTDGDITITDLHEKSNAFLSGVTADGDVTIKVDARVNGNPILHSSHKIEIDRDVDLNLYSPDFLPGVQVSGEGNIRIDGVLDDLSLINNSGSKKMVFSQGKTFSGDLNGFDLAMSGYSGSDNMIFDLREATNIGDSISPNVTGSSTYLDKSYLDNAGNSLSIGSSCYVTAYGFTDYENIQASVSGGADGKFIYGGTSGDDTFTNTSGETRAVAGGAGNDTLTGQNGQRDIFVIDQDAISLGGTDTINNFECGTFNVDGITLSKELNLSGSSLNPNFNNFKTICDTKGDASFDLLSKFQGGTYSMNEDARSLVVVGDRTEHSVGDAKVYYIDNSFDGDAAVSATDIKLVAVIKDIEFKDFTLSNF